jgi:hypothetical protein
VAGFILLRLGIIDFWPIKVGLISYFEEDQTINGWIDLIRASRIVDSNHGNPGPPLTVNGFQGVARLFADFQMWWLQLLIGPED